MRQKVALFLVFLTALFFLSVGATKANGPPKITKTIELEAKLAKIEADLKQMKSEFAQVEKGLSEMKEGLGKIQKKLDSDEKAAKKAADKQKGSLFWAIIVIIIILTAFVCAYIIFGHSDKKKTS